MDLRGARVFITGGAGFLGKNIIQRLYSEADLTVYSRDEAKHLEIRKRFPKVRTVVGDIRNFERMRKAAAGSDVGIFAASMKQIDACDENPEEALEIIVHGAQNSRRVVEEIGIKAAVFISTDKSRAATTIYGAMKYVAGEIFISQPPPGARLTTAIYGNVMNSTGSIVPVIWSAIAAGRSLELFGAEMTRFMITGPDAVELIVKSLHYSGVNVIPRLPSFKVLELFEIYHERFGLQYSVGRPRPNEKVHEIMACGEEIRRMIYMPDDDLYLMCPKPVGSEPLRFPHDEYSSRDCVFSRSELVEFLEANRYFKPQ